MVVELLAGWWTGSMALWADGWHMASHAGALGLSLLAYVYARTHLTDPRFAFGTGKLFSLAGFGSAIALTFVSLLMMLESAVRLTAPVDIDFENALPVAVLGPVINIVSAALLRSEETAEQANAAIGHGHDHGHGPGGHGPGSHSHAHGDHSHAHGDHNLRRLPPRPRRCAHQRGGDRSASGRSRVGAASWWPSGASDWRGKRRKCCPTGPGPSGKTRCWRRSNAIPT